MCASCAIGRHDCLRPGTCTCPMCHLVAPYIPPDPPEPTHTVPRTPRKRSHVGTTMTTSEADEIQAMVCELIARLLDATDLPPEILLR